MERKVYRNFQYPDRAKDLSGNEEDFSVDVITCDKAGMLNIGYWNYDTETWGFHTDTLTDPYEGGKLVDFVWMYRPSNLNYKLQTQAPVNPPKIKGEEWMNRNQ